MKKYLIIFISIISFSLFFSCEKEETKIEIDLSQAVAPMITNPTDSMSYVLLMDSSAAAFDTITWSDAFYGDENLAQPNYVLTMSYSDTTETKTVTLSSSAETEFALTVGELNQKLLAFGMEPLNEYEISFNVESSITNATTNDNLKSEGVYVKVTPFSDVVDVPPIYLLGGGSSAGWDNNTNLAAYYLPESGADSSYAIVDSLTPKDTLGSDGFIKFIRNQGAWAPMWGAIADSEWESGTLTYRPTESDPDPVPIPCPPVIDDYIITVDIVNLTYSITETVQTLHIIGDATDAGWTNTDAIPMVKEAPGKFSLVANLSADASEGFKFLEYQGQWAPMYGQDSNGTFESGKLQYRPTEADPDPMSIPPPSISGSYLIEVDIAAGTYKVTAQ